MSQGRIFTDLSASIAASESLSAAVDLDPGPKKGLRLCGFEIPSTWTAANVTLQVSKDGTTWLDVFDRNGEVVFTVDVATASNGNYVAVPPSIAAAFSFVKIRSGTGETPVAQSGAKEIVLHRRVL